MDALAPSRSTVNMLAATTLTALLLTGCGGDDESSSAHEEADRTLRLVATGLQDGDGPVVCAHMYREAQEALFRKYGEENCIEAVASARKVSKADGGVPAMDDANYDEQDGVVTAAGPQASRLAELLGLPGLYLSEFEGDWTLQGSAKPPAIRERM